MTIIVLLILSGVSLNAIIGDNGIITNAQNANIKQSEAAIQEFLQELYVGDYDNATNDILPITQMMKKYSNYFYNPKADPTINTGYDYIYYYDDTTDSYYDLYFIKVSGLPEQLRKSVVGGYAEDSTGVRERYLGYMAFADCYLVTQDLDVRYLNEGKVDTSILKKDTDGGLKTAYTASDPWTKLLGGDGSNSLSIQDAMGVSDLTITNDSGIEDLTNIYALSNLKKLTLINYTGSLRGLGNASSLTWLCIDNSGETTDIDYAGIEGVTGLAELYFYMPTDDECEKLFTAMHNTDYTQLKTIGLYGWRDLRTNIASLNRETFTTDPIRSSLSTVESLGLLSANTQKAVTVLFLNNNSISDLSGIEGFSGISALKLRFNYIEDIDEISGMTNLQTIDLGYNSLTNINGLANINNYLAYVDVDANEDLESLAVFIREKTNSSGVKYNPISELYAEKLPNLDFNTNTIVWTDEAKEKIGRIVTFKLDSKYSLAFSNKAEVKLPSTITNEELLQLQNNAYIRFLYMQNCSNLDDDTLNAVLETLPNLVYLNAVGTTGMKTLGWVPSNLTSIYLRGTSVTNIEPLFNLQKLIMVSLDNTQKLYIEGNTTHNTSAGNFISRVCCNVKDHSGLGGFEAGDTNILKQVEKLSNLERFGGYVNNTIEYTLDLSGTSVKTITLCRNLCTGLILPYTVERIENESANVTVNYKSEAEKICNLNYILQNWYQKKWTIKGKCTNLSVCWRIAPGSTFNKSYFVLPEGSSFDEVLLTFTAGSLSNIDFSHLAIFKDIKKLYISNCKITNYDLKYIDRSIEYLCLYNMWVGDLKIKTLPSLNLLTNLISLDVRRDNFSSLEPFLCLENLEHDFYLDLRNNCLEKTFTVQSHGTKNTFDYLLSMPNIKGIAVSGNSAVVDYIKDTNYNNYNYNGWSQWYEYQKNVSGTSYTWRAINENMTSPSYCYEKGTQSRFVDTCHFTISP